MLYIGKGLVKAPSTLGVGWNSWQAGHSGNRAAAAAAGIAKAPPTPPPNTPTHSFSQAPRRRERPARVALPTSKLLPSSSSPMRALPHHLAFIITRCSHASSWTEVTLILTRIGGLEPKEEPPWGRRGRCGFRWWAAVARRSSREASKCPKRSGIYLGFWNHIYSPPPPLPSPVPSHVLLCLFWMFFFYDVVCVLDEGFLHGGGVLVMFWCCAVIFVAFESMWRLFWGVPRGGLIFGETYVGPTSTHCCCNFCWALRMRFWEEMCPRMWRDDFTE